VIAAPPVALAVSPPRLVVAAGETRAIRVTNLGAGPATVDASSSGYAVALRGRPFVAPGRPPLVLRPRRLAIPPGRTVTLAVSASAASAEPGDRPALVLLTARGARRGVAFDVRVGVLVLVRTPGRVVHRLVPLALRVRGPTLELALRNRGTVSERIALRVRLYRRGRLLAVARAVPRELLPASRGLCVLPLPRRLHGRVEARVLGSRFGLALP
jgi:hypothetical protein